MEFAPQKERQILEICARRLEDVIPSSLGLALTTYQSASVLPLACIRKLFNDLLQEAERILSEMPLFPCFPTYSEQLLHDGFQTVCNLSRSSLLVTLHVAHWMPRRGHLLDMRSKWLSLRAA